MASSQRLIAVPDEPTWRLVKEISETTPSKSWVLVGGLPVQLHAIAANLNAIRPTDDLDALIDVASGSFSTFGGALRRIGFAESIPSHGGPFHRFVRDQNQVDVLVARRGIRWVGTEVFRAPGTNRAIQNTVDFQVQIGGIAQTRLVTPSSEALLLMKCAAFAADSRWPERHLDDIVTLLACGPDPTLIGALSRSERARIRATQTVLGDPLHQSWMLLSSPKRGAAQQVWAQLVAL